MYQIEVQARYGQVIDMDAVCDVLADLMTDDQVLPDGVEARERNRVYVTLGSVREAVRRINTLGYATDEDEDEAEDAS